MPVRARALEIWTRAMVLPWLSVPGLLLLVVLVPASVVVIVAMLVVIFWPVPAVVGEVVDALPWDEAEIGDDIVGAIADGGDDRVGVVMLVLWERW